MTIRAVEMRDFEVICSHRRRMFEEAGVAETVLEAIDGPFEMWLAPRLKSGEYFGFVAEEEGVVVAGVGLRLLDWPEHPLHSGSGQRGYVLNVFVEPEYRGKGLAKSLMLRAEEEFRARGVEYATLHASTMGRPVYEALGWAVTAEMGKRLG
jgi:ribosomal protein S18 acetylase RimI-like enzyme